MMIESDWLSPLCIHQQIQPQYNLIKNFYQMRLVTQIFLMTLSLSIIALIILVVSLNSLPSKRTDHAYEYEVSFLQGNLQTNPYSFRNPLLANKVLSLLDVFKPVNDSYFMSKTETKNKYDVPFLGLKNDEEYCEKHRAYFVKNPNFVFEEMNFVFSEPAGSFFRKTMISLGAHDIHKYIGDHMPEEQKSIPLYSLDPSVNIFFTKAAANQYKHIGKHFSCLSQLSNHIPGHSTLSRKDFVAENAIQYGKRFADRPHCFNHNKFFPRTWLLSEKESCEEFFNILNSSSYTDLKKERRIVFIRKIAVFSHRGEGVQPVDEREEIALRSEYEEGKKCGEVKRNYIIQNFIHNPLLIDGRKFDFRIYMLIASSNPLIVYYHDGFLRVSLSQYDTSSNEKNVLLTNLALNQKIYDDAQEGILFNGMNEEELKRAQQWSLFELQTYLLEKGIINDPEWLDNYLRPEFKKAMVHLLRLSSYAFLENSSVYELYGVDFMLDTDLNLWFIEANASPAFKDYSQPMEKFIVKMLNDHLEIVFGLLRSRMKRVIQYVNKLIDEGEVETKKSGQKVTILHLKEKRKEFEHLIRNYFEKEFEPSRTNGFSKIIDGNFEGIEIYQGLISPECL